MSQVFDLVQQLAVLDALLSNWDAVRMRVGAVSSIIEEQLSRIALSLSTATSSDQFASAIGELQTLVSDTPAKAFVDDLIKRASLYTGQETRIRTFGMPASTDQSVTIEITERRDQAGKDLGEAVRAKTDFLAVPVLFGTNRKYEPSLEDGYSGEIDESVTYGAAYVTIPVAAHETGKVETPKWWSLYPKTDQKRFVVFGEIQRLQQAQFTESLRVAFAAEDPGGDLLVFIHGYNVTFEDAARRAAQLAYDLRIRGLVVLFSWPSLGRTLGYWADEDRSAASTVALANFLHSLAGGPWRRIHIMAHSMGSRVLFHGLADNPFTNVALGQIIFVAADLYVDVFRQKFSKIPRTGNLVTSYVSKADRALCISNLMHRASRVGFLQTAPFVMDGLETIDASWVNTSVLGHSYYGDERTVINDLGYLIREGFPAERRGLHQSSGTRYWNFPR